MHFAGFFLNVTAIALLLINPAFSENSTPSDYPVYKDGKLTIPRVDTDAQTGNYQKVEFQFDNSTNSWKLINYIETKVSPESTAYQEKVEVIIVDSSPLQVFLKINGYLGSCNFFQQINQKLKGSKFEVVLHVGPNPFPPDIVCTANAVFFEKIIPLQVYGLPAGTYEYQVGEHTGSFSLNKDNNL